MSIQLAPDVERRIRAMVTSGRFASENDVLREAIESLEKFESVQEKIRRLESRNQYLSECAKFDPAEEQAMAEEWLDGERELWNAS